MSEVTLEVPKWLMNRFKNAKDLGFFVCTISIFMVGFFLFGFFGSILLFGTFSV